MSSVLTLHYLFIYASFLLLIALKSQNNLPAEMQAIKIERAANYTAQSIQ